MFKNTCVKFYIELINQIYKRFNFNDEVFKNVSALNPENIIKKKSISVTIMSTISKTSTMSIPIH